MYERYFKICDIANIYQVTDKTIYNIINTYKENSLVNRKICSGEKMDENIINALTNIIKDNQDWKINSIDKHITY